MDAYPLNLILAVATASTSIFIGFLPTKTISSTFFARESAKFILAWVLVALSSPSQVVHYPLIFAFLCFAAWWHFRRDNAFTGKMWLSMASGLSISIGVMFILAVTPRAYPPGLSPLSEGLLLASIYLGGAVIGLAYVCFTFIQGAKSSSGVTQSLIQRYVGLLPYLTLARAAVILGTFFLFPGHYESKITYPNTSDTVAIPYTSIELKSTVAYVTEGHFSLTDLIVLCLTVFILPVLALLAQNQTSLSSRVQPTRTLIAIVLVGFLTEILARYLVL